MKTLRLGLIVATAAFLLPVTAGAKDSVTGKLTAKGQTASFSYVYAFRKEPWPGAGKPNLHVLLSDKPVPARAIPTDDTSVRILSGLTREGAIHALELRFVGDNTAKLFDSEQGAIYHNAIWPARMGVTGPLKYVPAKGAPKTISGRVSVVPTKGSSLDWSCEATFVVAVPAR